MIKGDSLVLAVLLAAAAPAFAQPPPPQPAAQAPSGQGVPWSSLSGEQQKLLGKFGGSWSTLPPERQRSKAGVTATKLLLSSAPRACFSIVRSQSVQRCEELLAFLLVVQFQRQVSCTECLGGTSESHDWAGHEQGQQGAVRHMDTRACCLDA